VGARVEEWCAWLAHCEVDGGGATLTLPACSEHLAKRIVLRVISPHLFRISQTVGFYRLGFAPSRKMDA